MKKVLFIPLIKKTEKENIDLSQFAKLPKKLYLLYSIQYKKIAETILSSLKEESFEITGFEQVLGCSKISKQGKKNNGALLLIGSGRFHAINIAFSSGREVYIYDLSNIGKITKEEIERYANIIKAKKTQFLYSNNIGIIISSKPGQNKKEEARELKSRIEKKFSDKKVYLFIADNIGLVELENFPEFFFVNTACPGLEMDSPRIINQDNIKELL